MSHIRKKGTIYFLTYRNVVQNIILWKVQVAKAGLGHIGLKIDNLQVCLNKPAFTPYMGVDPKSPYSTRNTLLNTNEMDTKNMKCTWPTRDQTPRTQRKLYSTGWRWGLALGITQILALGNAKIYQHVGISNAKFWRRGHCPTPTPDARYFAFWWNIGFSHMRNSTLIQQGDQRFS